MPILSLLFACQGGNDTGQAPAETSPKAVDVVLSPDEPREGEVLTCSYTFEGTEAGSVQWKVNGVPISVTDDSLDSSWWDREDWVRCVVTPDGGSAVDSNLVQIANSAPVPTSVTILPDDPTVDDTVVYAELEVEDPDPADSELYYEVTYSWTVNGDEAGIDEYAIGRAYFEKGDVVGLGVQIRQYQDRSPLVEADPVTIGNAPPSQPQIAIEGELVGDEPISCVVVAPSEDPDGDAVSYAFVWRSFGVVTDYVDTDGQADSFTLAAGDVLAGGSYTCEVTPSDDDGGVGEVATTTTQVGGGVMRYLWSTTSAAARAGTTLVAVEDQDGDGAAEIFVGAPHASDNSTQGGAAYLLSSMAFGDESTVEEEAVVWEVQGGSTTEYAGSALAALDLDGDRYADLGIGAPGWRATDGSDAGAVYLFRSDGSALEEADALTVYDATLTHSAANADERTGTSLLDLDDCYLHGVRQACVVVGVPGLVDQGDVKGGLRIWPEDAVDTFSGQLSGSVDEGAMVVLGSGDGVGSLLTHLPDLDGDGFDDLAVASAGSGSIHLLDADAFYEAPADTAAPAPSFLAIENLTYATLSGADTDELTSMVHVELESGGSALLVGGPGNGSDNGAAWLWEVQGGDHLLEDQIAMSGVDGMRLGNSVAQVGERRDEQWVAFGAPGADVTFEDAGAVYAVRLDEWTSSSTVESYGGELVATYGEEAFDAFGTALAGPVDIDGDGRFDLVVGAPRLDAAGVGFDVGGVVVWRTW